jgi:hypothetical protein
MALRERFGMVIDPSHLTAALRSVLAWYMLRGLKNHPLPVKRISLNMYWKATSRANREARENWIRSLVERVSIICARSSGGNPYSGEGEKDMAVRSFVIGRAYLCTFRPLAGSRIQRYVVKRRGWTYKLEMKT